MSLPCMWPLDTTLYRRVLASSVVDLPPLHYQCPDCGCVFDELWCVAPINGYLMYLCDCCGEWVDWRLWQPEPLVLEQV